MTSKERFRVWLMQAKYDLEAAKNSIDDKSYEWACYQSVQSVEKVLKAVLIHAGWRPPKIHKIGVLLSMCNHANKAFFDVKLNYRKVEGYTFISRYPFILPREELTPHDLIKKEDAETCLKLASDIYSKIDEFLQKNIFVQGDSIDLEKYYYTVEEVKTRINELIKDLKNCDKLDVNKIILFGSFARENTRPKSSTMDILVVANTGMDFIERIQYIKDLTKGGEPIIEPLVYTPEEFTKMTGDQAEGFLESAIEEGRVIYEKVSISN